MSLQQVPQGKNFSEKLNTKFEETAFSKYVVLKKTKAAMKKAFQSTPPLSPCTAPDSGQTLTAISLPAYRSGQELVHYLQQRR